MKVSEQGVNIDMSAAEKRILEPVEGHYNLTSYEAARSSFSWDVETRNLHFRKTGQANAAYETIDRHVDEGHGETTALHYLRGSFRQTLSFQEDRKSTRLNSSHVALPY